MQAATRAPKRFGIATLRGKTLVLLISALLGLMVLVYVPLRLIMLGNFSELEHQTVATNLERVQNALAFDIKRIDNAAVAWATWTEAYAYAETRDQAFIDDNIFDGVFTSYNINLLMYINSAGELLYGRITTLNPEVEQPLPPELLAHIAANPFLLRHDPLDSNQSGIMLLPQGAMVIVTRPILTGTGEGPSRGVVLLGRYLDLGEIESLTELTQFPFSVYPLGGQALPSDVEAARGALEGSSEPQIRILNDDAIAGYALLKDIQGRPGAIARVEVARNIYSRGSAGVTYVMLAILAASLLFGLVVMGLLERLILARVAGLGASVATIGRRSDLSSRVEVSGSDELAELGGAINATLDALEHAQAEHEHAEVERVRLQQDSLRAQEDRLRMQDELIRLQTAAIAEQATPLIPISDTVVVMPLIGSIDAQRAEQIMSTLLGGVVERRAQVAIIDITGVAVVDTQVAGMILQAAHALQLLGTRVVLTGIRPVVAQTLVALGIEFAGLATYGTLQDGIAHAITAERAVGR